MYTLKTNKGHTMTKKETFDTVIGLCEAHKAPKALVEALTEILEPKGGGPVMDIDAVTKKDDQGNIVEIQCSLSGVFLPATSEKAIMEDMLTKAITPEEATKKVTKLRESKPDYSTVGIIVPTEGEEA